MRKSTHIILCMVVMAATFGLTACGEYYTATKYGDIEYKYELAKACYIQGQYTRATELFTDMIFGLKGTGIGEECLYLAGMSAYMGHDYETASQTFRKYYQSYPRGTYVELAHYYCGLALYDNVADPRLDQATTHQAIAELQGFLDAYPYTTLKAQTQDMIFRLQDHLVEKQFLAAQMYYNLGNYVGNCNYGGSNYEACIVTSENALRDFPYASAERREQFGMLILRSRYHLARQSIEEKRLERFRETVDEYYGFINEFPESVYLKEAQGYLNKSQRALKGQLDED